MKVRDLIEALQNMPPDAEMISWDPDEECMVPVTGLLYSPESAWLDFDPGVEDMISCAGEAVAIQTDAD